jgi:hypothetical protein
MNLSHLRNSPFIAALYGSVARLYRAAGITVVPDVAGDLREVIAAPGGCRHHSSHHARALKKSERHRRRHARRAVIHARHTRWFNKKFRNLLQQHQARARRLLPT